MPDIMLLYPQKRRQPKSSSVHVAFIFIDIHTYTSNIPTNETHIMVDKIMIPSIGSHALIPRFCEYVTYVAKENLDHR